ncbi:MAG: apolipoprotein acyltransferase [Pseudomonadota bacterium]
MIYLTLSTIGALIGGMTAYRRRGNRKDIAQYAASYAIFFALIGLILTIFIDRSLMG